MLFNPLKFLFILLLSFSIVQCSHPQQNRVKEKYDKHEFLIEMRDGVKLFTAVYTPKDKSKNYPIILNRTPYSVAPYGEDNFIPYLGASDEFVDEGFIFVLQDVRGRYMSEGEFEDMRPYIPNKTSNKDVDESSDTYDTIDWLIKNINNNNGKVGLWGISYPGFYAIMGAIDAHPNLVCVSPQAPISDWFLGDDVHHNGAFCPLMFDFFRGFGIPRTGPTTKYPEVTDYITPDAYNFFLENTPIKKLNENYLKHKIPFWDSIMVHSNYDYYWQAHSNLKHIKNIKPALLIVSGWFDSEDMYGPLNIYKSIEKNDPLNNSIIVVGPWTHGSWSYIKGDSLGDFSFGSSTADYYRKEILLPFFKYYLKGEGKLNLKEAYVFDTGKNQWDAYDAFPPNNSVEINFYLQAENKLSEIIPNAKESFSEYVSDPFNPVPYTAKILEPRNSYYPAFPIEDQRFASTRPDVLNFETESLAKDITIAGSIDVNLFVSTTGTDADFVVKLIDVYPDNEKDPEPNPAQIKMGGYERLIRMDIMRGKFRNSFENPQPFTSNKITEVNFNLNEAYHTFKAGHKIMIQVQSSFFPFFDVNPNTFCDIYSADKEKFVKAEIKIYHSNNYSSKIIFKVIN